MRDYAEVRADGIVTGAVADEALRREGVDERGLDRLDRAYLKTIAEGYGGGPVGINAIAATLTEDLETLEDVVEPYLLKIGFVQRTANGRKTTAAAFTHLGLDRAERYRSAGPVHVIERLAFLKALLVATGGLDIWDAPAPEPSATAAARAAADAVSGGGTTIRVRQSDGTIVALDVEKYLYGVVPLESPPSWPAAALQAQAIVARTYALQKRTLSRAYDVVASDAISATAARPPNVPRRRPPSMRRAVKRSRISAARRAFFTARAAAAIAPTRTSCGATPGSSYLRGVDDPYCTAAPDYRWQRTLPVDRVVRRPCRPAKRRAASRATRRPRRFRPAAHGHVPRRRRRGGLAHA